MTTKSSPTPPSEMEAAIFPNVDVPVGMELFTIRIEIQGGAGAGKSIIRDMLYEYLRGKDFPVGLTDADPLAVYTMLKD